MRVYIYYIPTPSTAISLRCLASNACAFRRSLTSPQRIVNHRRAPVVKRPLSRIRVLCRRLSDDDDDDDDDDAMPGVSPAHISSSAFVSRRRRQKRYAGIDSGDASDWDGYVYIYMYIGIEIYMHIHMKADIREIADSRRRLFIYIRLLWLMFMAQYICFNRINSLGGIDSLSWINCTVDIYIYIIKGRI